MKTALKISLIFLMISSIFFISGMRINTVVGDSMNPTYFQGDTLLSFPFRNLNRYDVVTVKIKDYIVIKRILGVPGDTIYYNQNDVLINNDNFIGNYNKIVLGKDQYFIIGDNRVISKDSRFYGPILKDQIVGRIGA